MRIVVFSHDLPWPLIHGGRIDMYNRLKAFKELNHDVFLVCWMLIEDNQREESISHIKNLVDGLVCFPRKKGTLNRVADLFIKTVKLVIQPNLVTQCSPSKKEFIKLKDDIEDFKPDVIFVENVYAAKLAYKYASEKKLPVFIRSHNIEHIYIKQMAKLSRSFNMKLHFLAMTANLKTYEKKMLQNADAFFDISVSDLKFWQSQGLNNGYWMPPIYYNNEQVDEKYKTGPVRFDVAYVGNLKSPNNVEGILWFLDDILPIIQRCYPAVRVLIAGSNPVKSVIDHCSKTDNITLLPNPKDVRSLYLQSGVLINPIRFGSGVNIKTVEMLHLPSPIVCTPKAIEGLPEESELLFDVAKSTEQFASKIMNYLDSAPTLVSRHEITKYFDPQYLAVNIKIMEKLKATTPTADVL